MNDDVLMPSCKPSRFTHALVQIVIPQSVRGHGCIVGLFVQGLEHKLSATTSVKSALFTRRTGVTNYPLRLVRTLEVDDV